jgi:hypothetical protein
MNREQRRYAAKGHSGERIEISGVVVHFENGQYIGLDPKKVDIQAFDKVTGRPMFKEVLEPTPIKIQDVQATYNSDDSAASLPKKPKHDEFKDEQKPRTEDYTVVFDTPEGKMEYVKKGQWSGVRPVSN